jgi:hypothetical protein
MIPSALFAQRGGGDATRPDSSQVIAGAEKSPFGAGLMSWLMPGLGSFYAGDSGHGTTHLAIAAGSFGLMAATADGCNLFGEDEPTCGVALAAALVFIGNGVWSIFTAVDDAKDHNRSLKSAGLELDPELVTFKMGSETNVGVQLLSFKF